MTMLNGTVNSLTPQSGTSKAGNRYTIWWAEIDGTRFKVGFDKPSWNVGDTVSVETRPNKYNELEMVKPGGGGGRSYGGGGGAPRKSAPSGGGGGGYSPKPFPLPADHGDNSIIRQNALTNANATLATYYGREDFAKGKTPEDLADLVISIAYKYADFSSGQREAKNKAAME